MEYILNAAAAALAAAVLGLALKKCNPELAMLLALSAALLVVYMAADALEETAAFIKEAGELANVSPAALGVVLKTIGIALITKLSADVCRDAGQSALSSGLETAGAAAALYVAMPLFRSVVGTIGSLI